MKPERFDFLLQQYLNDSLTQTQWDELHMAFSEGKFDDRMKEVFDEMVDKKYIDPAWSKEKKIGMWNGIKDNIQIAENQTIDIRSRSRIPKYWWAAAAILLILVSGTYFLLNRKSVPEPTPLAQTKKPTDIAPGGNKAVLTLGNGSKIILDSAANGMLAEQGNAKISKVKSGLLSYKASIEKSTEIFFNTLSTPRGGQYKLILPDGTAVWLNAASSITYPTAFKGNERKVTITGEAYFEVTKDKTKPFYVKVNEMEVEVLGTHFNINAYNDEKTISTTLLEGSVKIRKDNQTALLKPGQQAQNTGEEIKIMHNVNLDQVIAWKNGFFNFNKADLQSVMRQLGRWYDVEVVYERAIPRIQFLGEIERDLNLSDVLDVLKRTDVHFRIEGKKIIVLP